MPCPHPEPEPANPGAQAGGDSVSRLPRRLPLLTSPLGPVAAAKSGSPRPSQVDRLRLQGRPALWGQGLPEVRGREAGGVQADRVPRDSVPRTLGSSASMPHAGGTRVLSLAPGRVASDALGSGGQRTSAAPVPWPQADPSAPGASVSPLCRHTGQAITDCHTPSRVALMPRPPPGSDAASPPLPAPPSHSLLPRFPPVHILFIRPRVTDAFHLWAP